MREYDNAVEVKQFVNEGFFDGETPNSRDAKTSRTVYVMVNGVRNAIYFRDPAIARAINEGIDANKWVELILGRPTRWLSGAFTSKNPEFILANAVRDFQHAAFYHAADGDNGNFRDFARNLPHTYRVINRAMRGKANPLTIAERRGLDPAILVHRGRLIEMYGAERVDDTLFEIFDQHGGLTGFVFTQTPGELQRKLLKGLNAKLNVSGRFYEAAWNNTRRFFSALDGCIDRLAEVSEASTRYATFLATLDSNARLGEGRREKTVFDAVTMAKNITVNFNRRGTWSKNLGKAYIFFNASAQAMAQEYRMFVKNPKAFACYAAGTAARGYFMRMLQAAAMAAMNAGDGDDPSKDPYFIPLYTAQSNFVLPLYWAGLGHRYVKIPLPQGLRAFNAWGATLYDMTHGMMGAWEGVGELAMTFLDEHSPLPVPEKASLLRTFIPSALTPRYDIGVNMDSFGRRIHRDSFYDSLTPGSELGLKNANNAAGSELGNNANAALVWFARAWNSLGGGDRIRSAGIGEGGEERPWHKMFFDLNPSDIKHFIKYYQGGSIYGGSTFWRFYDTAEAIFSADSDVEVRDLPVVNRFFGGAYRRNPSGQFFEAKRKMENAHALYRKYGNDGGVIPPRTERANDDYEALKQYFKEYDAIKRDANSLPVDSPEFEELLERRMNLMRATNYLIDNVNWELPAGDPERNVQIRDALEKVAPLAPAPSGNMLYVQKVLERINRRNK
jgi:hypothetical protein